MSIIAGEMNVRNYRLLPEIQVAGLLLGQHAVLLKHVLEEYAAN